MKKISKAILFTALVLSTLLSACRKDKKVTIEDEQAVEMLSASIAQEGEDIQEETKSLHNAVVLANYASCGNELFYDYEWSRTWGSRYYELIVVGLRTTLCEEDELIGFQFDSEFSTHYEGPRWESNGTGTKNGTLLGFNTLDDYYIWNSNATSNTQGLVAQNGEQVATSLTWTSELEVDKEDHMINAGETQFTLTGNGDNVNEFNFSGLITFFGNRTANIELNGNNYQVSW